MPHLEHVPCHREQILVDADSPLDHIFFPDSGVVSVMAVYSDGGTIEMATIGREGCAGVQAVFGTIRSSARYWVQIPGSATKISRAAFTRAVRQMPSFRSLVYAYVQAFTEQVLLSGACNGAHGLKERLARWLLMMRDRSDEDVLPIHSWSGAEGTDMSVRTKKTVAAARREAVAYHEAGHAVVAHKLGYQVRRVSIAPKSGSAGHVSWRHPSTAASTRVR
jgi:CRP-like cAMP-binding protein